jgi:hypothetical protein
VAAEVQGTFSGQQDNALDMEWTLAGMCSADGKLLPSSLVVDEHLGTSAHQPYNKEDMAYPSSYTSRGVEVAVENQEAEVVVEEPRTFSAQEDNESDMRQTWDGMTPGGDKPHPCNSLAVEGQDTSSHQPCNAKDTACPSPYTSPLDSNVAS